DAVDPGLLGIDLPRMKLEDCRLCVAPIDPPQQPARQAVREKPEVSSAAGRQISSKHTCGRNRDLEHLGMRHVREAGSLRRTVVVMADGIDARAVSITGLRQALVGPEVVLADGEA